jgi:hypothetical protein
MRDHQALFSIGLRAYEIINFDIIAIVISEVLLVGEGAWPLIGHCLAEPHRGYINE